MEHRAILPRGGLLREPPEERDLGPAEAVDRLLGVTHHHQPARRRPRQELGDLHLQAVGVLELVDEEKAEAGAEVPADALAVPESGPGQEEEVEEIDEPALSLPLVVEGEHAAEGPHQPSVEARPPGRAPGRGTGPRPLRDLPRLLEGLRGGPARLVAEVLRDFPQRR